MLLGTLLGSIAVIILLILIIVGVMWLGKPWVIQWIKGTAGILMLFGGFFLAFAAVDIFTYSQTKPNQPAVTITTYELGNQNYDVSLVGENGQERRYVVKGDQWQLDVRLLRWNGPFASLGAEPVYRLDRLSGRYLSLEQERTDERTVHSLDDSNSWIDVWKGLKDVGFWLKPEFGSAVFMPLANGATFAVTIDGEGVNAEPLNNVAIDAMNGNW